MKTMLAASVFAAVSISSASHATSLFDVTNLDGTYTEALSFVASNTTTTLDVAGYNLPSGIEVLQNTVTTGGGGNLLGSTWTFTPAPVGSDAFTFYDGTGVDALVFESTVVGSYDQFSQSFATTVGSTYTYSFVYNNSFGDDPSGLRVSVYAGGVPESATWALMLIGLGGSGAAMRVRRGIRPQLG